MDTAIYPSRSEAEAEAVRWLAEFAGDGDYDWEWDTPNTLACEPVTGFPCRVMVLATRVGDGFVPCMAFTAGLKYEGRYWQGRITDENDLPLPPQAALSELKTVLGVLVPASQTLIPG